MRISRRFAVLGFQPRGVSTSRQWDHQSVEDELESTVGVYVLVRGMINVLWTGWAICFEAPNEKPDEFVVFVLGKISDS